jgi:hypothetical protein
VAQDDAYRPPGAQSGHTNDVTLRSSLQVNLSLQWSFVAGASVSPTKAPPYASSIPATSGKKEHVSV